MMVSLVIQSSLNLLGVWLCFQVVQVSIMILKHLSWDVFSNLLYLLASIPTFFSTYGTWGCQGFSGKIIFLIWFHASFCLNLSLEAVSFSDPQSSTSLDSSLLPHLAQKPQLMVPWYILAALSNSQHLPSTSNIQFSTGDERFSTFRPSPHQMFYFLDPFLYPNTERVRVSCSPGKEKFPQVFWENRFNVGS